MDERFLDDDLTTARFAAPGRGCGNVVYVSCVTALVVLALKP